MTHLLQRGRFRAVLAAAGAALAAAALTALPASASAVPPGGTAQNTAGEAGYYVAHWDNWHIRDAHAAFKVTAADMSLNGSSAYPGAVGVELCDDSNGYAAQLGLTYLNGTFEVLGASGSLDQSNGGSDPCTQNGVILTSSQNPAVQLAGSNATFNTTISGGGASAWVVPGNAGQPGVDETPVAAGDTLHLDLYYNPQWHWGGHDLQFTVQVYDAAGHFVRETQVIRKIPAENFYEAAAGVANTEAPRLTAPALNPLNSFYASFDNYNGSIRNRLRGGEDLVQAVTVNGAQQVTLQPSAITGNAFSIAEGSATP